ncbi:MAG TPA: O-antigen ligase family protein [Gaiellaceae bacterium]|nr:O-antigen ligase family protein [Gaiellaceae bacterium]
MTDGAAILGALGAAAVLCGSRRLVLAAGFAALAVAELLLAHAGGLHLSTRLIGAGVVGVAVLCGLAALLLRARWLVIPLVAVAAPFRLPLDFGRSHRYFVAVAHGGQLGRLLPLYLVLAVATLALLWDLVRQPMVAAMPRDIAWPTAAFLAFASISATWSIDVGSARNELEYFLLPFAVLVAVAGRAPFPANMPRLLGIIAISLATVFAVVGLVEEATHRLIFYAHNLQVSNTYTSFFRVTSLFRDPSLYGRHVVLGIGVLVVCMWLRKIDLVPATILMAIMWAGLYFSYSQSSYAALFVVVLAVTLVAGDTRARRVAIVAAIAVVLIGGAIAASKVVHTSVRKATSDRSRRITLTAKAFAHHPLAGVGLGGQPRASQRLAAHYGPLQNFVSHTTPLTVAAELGIVGLALYVLLLLGGARAIDDVRRRNEALGLSLAAVFLALFVHSLAYSGFFEDPITWLVLAIASAFLLQPEPSSEPARATAEAREAVTTP